MVCIHPKIAYQRKYYPISGNCSEDNLKRLNKISFTYKKGWRQIELPCGECPACKLSKANEWATRIECEAKTWNNKGIFVTLTYNSHNLPKNKDGTPTLLKSDMQKFKKRLRKYVKKHQEAISYWKNPHTEKTEKPVRTFECGEYGPKNGRPHYHQIIFNWIPNDLVEYKISKDGHKLYKSKTLQKIWGKGFIIIGMISYESASYVARYTMKKNGLAKVKREYYTAEEIDKKTGEIKIKTKFRNIKGKIENEFITMSTSPGIGAQYFYENFQKIKNNNGILINIKGTAKIKKIPRYFRKLWEKKDWEDFERWKLRNKNIVQEQHIKKIESYKLPSEWHILKKEKFVREKELDNQKHKFRLLKRENIDEDNA